MGPLAGLRVVELGGIGPAPFCGMMLADMGAEVIRVDRIADATSTEAERDILNRGRKRIAIDLKQSEGRDLILQLLSESDILIEGFRPGVMERLGLGPDECLGENPRLVFGRVTGWGQNGTYSSMAGHDINYIAVTGALHSIGRAEGPPVPPLNLIGDFGGGATFLAFGVLCAVHHARSTGTGQVVDAAIVDGTAALTSMQQGLLQDGRWTTERGTNILDSGAPFYDVYECLDGEYVAVGAIEARFFQELMDRLELDSGVVLDGLSHLDSRVWPRLRQAISAKIATRSRAEWAALFEGTDGCLVPVMSLAEAPQFGPNQSRGVFEDVDGMIQPAPAPRFSRTPGHAGRSAYPGEHTSTILTTLGLSEDEIRRLHDLQVVSSGSGVI